MSRSGSRREVREDCPSRWRLELYLGAPRCSMKIRSVPNAVGGMLAAIGLLALGPAGVLGSQAVEETSILVTGPLDWRPDPGYSVEIGDQTWTIDLA